MRLLKTSVLMLLFISCTFSAIQFSGSSFTATFATTGVKQDLINSIETALLNGGSGWTTVSGHLTANLLMASGTTPQSLQIRARFKDNGGAGIQVYMENSTSTLGDTLDTNHGATLLATSGRTYRVIGSLYQFVILSPQIIGGVYNRGFVWIGVPYLPSFVVGGTTAAGWMGSSNLNDGDTTIRNCLTTIGIMSDYSNSPNSEALLNGSYWSVGNSTTNGRSDVNIGTLRMLFTSICSEVKYDVGAVNAFSNTLQWGDGTTINADVYMAWGSTAFSVEAKIRGQIWDAIYMPVGAPSGETITNSGHTFMNVVSMWTGLNTFYLPASIWIAIN